MIFPAYIEEMDNIDYSITYTNKAKILFVGGNFFPNIFGIKWFVKNVLSEMTPSHLRILNYDDLYEEYQI